MYRFFNFDKTDVDKQMLQDKSIYVINFENIQGELLCKSHPTSRSFHLKWPTTTKNELMI